MAKSVVNYARFSLMYSDEDECRKKLFQMRWSNGFVCPHCGCTEYYLIEKRNRYQCKQCKKQISVTSGTIMHKTHLSLVTWFRAIYLVSRDKRAYSALRISEELNISGKAAWFLLHRLRKAMGSELDRKMLSGIVEIDDVKFGRKSDIENRPRGIGKQLAMVGLSVDPEGHPLFIRIRLVKNRSGKTIGDFAKNSICAGSLIQTNELKSYRESLKNKHLGEYDLANSNSEALRWLKVITTNAKHALIGTFHGLDEKYLQSYFDEFCYRFNFRKYRETMFEDLMLSAVQSKPCTYAELKI
ncbi:MAG: IS1595 family transposase [Clostridia bacterium]